MRESLEDLKEQLDDEEYRHGYAQAFLNSYVAAQIKFLREQQGMTQTQLAEKIGTKQAGISRLENVNHSTWKVETLSRLAKALDLRLRISFEEFGTMPDEIEGFGRERLQRNPYKQDPVFNPKEFAALEDAGRVDSERVSNFSVIAFQAKGSGVQSASAHFRTAKEPEGLQKALSEGKVNAA